MNPITHPDFGDHYGPLSPEKWIYHRDSAEAILQGKCEALKPTTVHLVPTLRCNHRCYFCTYGGAKGSLRPGDTRVIAQATILENKSKDMPFDKMLSTIDQLHEAGIKGVIFTGGGDPSLYPSLIEGMRYCRSKQIDISMNTNGFLLSETLIKELIALEPTYLRISLNAGSPLVQELITGTKSFAKVVNNLKILAREKVKQNKKTDISTGYVVNVVNVNDVMNHVMSMRKIEKEIWEELGTQETAIYSIQIRPVSNYESSKFYQEKRIKTIETYLREEMGDEYAKEFIRFMYEEGQTSQSVLNRALMVIEQEAIPFLKSQGSKIQLIYPRQKYLDLPTVKNKPYNKCLACQWFLFIWPDGTVYPCIEWAGTPGFEIGNLSQNTVAEILQGQQRKDKIQYINSEALHRRCAPICAHHEMNISMNQFYQSKVDYGSLKQSYQDLNDMPPHINFL